MSSPKQLRLGDLTESQRPITYGVVKPGPEQEDGIPFVRGGDVLGGRITTDALRTITPSVSAEYKRTLLRGGELLVSLVGNPGEVAIVPETLASANIARQVGLVALRSEVNARFVMYYLMSPRGRADLFTQTGGAVQQVINLADLKRVVIPIPSRLEQDRIADVLSAYDDLIENNRRRMALLEDAARQLYQEWFVRLRFPGHEHARIIDGVPEGWESKRLGDVAALNYGKALKASDRVDGAFPVYGSSGVVGSHKKPLVDGPGIVVGRKGTVGSVFWCPVAYWPIDTVYFIDAGASDLWLYWALQHLRFVNSDGAVPGLNRGYAHAQPIHVPDRGVRQQFLEIAEPMYRQIAVLQKTNDALRAARDLLLPRLMSGEVAV